MNRGYVQGTVIYIVDFPTEIDKHDLRKEAQCWTMVEHVEAS